MNELRTVWQSLPARVGLAFTAVVLLTAAASWFPELWLLRVQRYEQAWLQLEQGMRTGSALHRRSETEIRGIVSRAAQRGRLQVMVAQRDTEALLNYLSTIETGLDLDLLLVCDASGAIVAQVGSSPTPDVCKAGWESGYHVVARRSGPEVWLVATDTIEDGASVLGQTIAGRVMDHAFAVELSRQTGLEHTLLVEGQPVATSFGRDGLMQAATSSDRRAASRDDPEDGSYTFRVGGTQYYARNLSLAAQRLEDQMALDITNILDMERQIRQTGAALLLLTMVSALGLAAILAHTISSPLSKLAHSATRLSQGDLDAAVRVPTTMSEVAVVAQALEDARQNLRSTLADLQDQKTWISHLLDTVVEGIATVDPYEKITFWSTGAEHVVGWSREAVLGRDCNEVFRLVESDQHFTELLPPPNQRRRISVLVDGDKRVTLSVTCAEMAPNEGGDASLVLVFRDVSEEEAVQRLLGHFLANMTHEFRTPLAALGAAIELLLDQLPSLSEAELQELLRSLHLGIFSLQTLIDNLLESASLEAGRFNVSTRRADLREIVGEAARTMEPLLTKYGQHLVLDVPATLPYVRADARRTIQVLINLIANASKYGPADAEITLAATRQDGVVCVIVGDRGVGVPEEQREALFDRFVHFGGQGDSLRYGTGLGLWVVKSIVEAQGGEVGTGDRSGGGSNFWFTVPVAEEA